MIANSVENNTNNLGTNESKSLKRTVKKIKKSEEVKEESNDTKSKKRIVKKVSKSKDENEDNNSESIENNNSDEKKVELNENPPTLTINALGGSDGIVNIPEWTAGLTISGNTNAETGSVLKISLTDTSGNILSGFENIAGQVNGGIWSATMPTNSRPSGDFKVKAEITNQAGNSKTVTSSNITTDFVPANVSGISDNVTGIASSVPHLRKEVLYPSIRC